MIDIKEVIILNEALDDEQKLKLIEKNLDYHQSSYNDGYIGNRLYSRVNPMINTAIAKKMLKNKGVDEHQYRVKIIIFLMLLWIALMIGLMAVFWVIMARG
jgi:hypothetical protein